MKEDRLTRREQEMARGRKQLKINMARGLIEEVQKSIDAGYKFEFTLLPHTEDLRQWGVRVDFKNGQAHAENWWEFPTDELRTKIMLFGGTSKDAYTRE